MEKRQDNGLMTTLKLVLPMSVQYAINQFVNIIDNLMVGDLGEDCISAISVAGTYSWLNLAVTGALSAGSMVVIAKLWGANKKDNIKSIMSFVFFINCIFGIGFFLVTSIFPVQILRIYSNIEGIIEPGVAYFSIFKYAMLFNGMSVLLIGLMQAVHSVKIGLYASLSSCLFNVFFNYALIFGKFGFPQLGIRGAAIATLIARSIELLVCLVYIFKFEQNIQFRIKDFNLKLDKPQLKELLVIILPLLLVDVQANLASSLQTIITGHISKYYISANAIVHLSWQLCTFFSYGLMAGSNIIIGNAVGSGDKEKTKQYCKKFALYGWLIGLAASGLIQVVRPVVAGFFNVQPETLSLAKLMSYAASVNVIFLISNYMLLHGIYKVVENTKTILYCNIIGNWLIALPLGFLCAFVFNTNAAIIYYVLRAGNMFNALAGVYLLKKKGWI